MKFSEKFKKNKGEAAVPETAQDSGKKKHKPDPKKLVGTISKKHIKNGSYSMAMAAVFIVIVVVINIDVYKRQGQSHRDRYRRNHQRRTGRVYQPAWNHIKDR